jgi:hypothetical protein
MVQYPKVQGGSNVHDGKCATGVAGASGENVYYIEGAHLGGGGAQLFHAQPGTALLTTCAHITGYRQSNR